MLAGHQLLWEQPPPLLERLREPKSWNREGTKETELQWLLGPRVTCVCHTSLPGSGRMPGTAAHPMPPGGEVQTLDSDHWLESPEQRREHLPRRVLRGHPGSLSRLDDWTAALRATALNQELVSLGDGKGWAEQGVTDVLMGTGWALSRGSAGAPLLPSSDLRPPFGPLQLSLGRRPSHQSHDSAPKAPPRGGAVTP